MNKNHRPTANYKGEVPKVPIEYGVEGIKVTLDAYGPDNPYRHLLREIQSTWGDKPYPQVSEAVDFTKEEMTLIKDCIRGKSLGQCLEAITTMWTIEGVSRACTHQLVRTRIGAGFMQQGGRNNDWRHHSWRMPEALVRMCQPEPTKVFGLKDCVIDEVQIKRLLLKYGNEGKYLEDVIRDYLEMGKDLYGYLVDAGLAYQDARRLLPIGTTTWIHCNYSFATLKNLLANRLEFCMDWEINAVAQLMVREVKMRMPDLFGNSLKSHSDKLRRAAFGDHVDDFVPDQKYPYPWKQSERTHRPEQHPFFVLTENAINGGDIEWIKTNGIYPNRDRGEIK